MRVLSVVTYDSIRNRHNFLMITLNSPRSAHISLAVYSKEYQQLEYTRVSPDERYDANQHSFMVRFATRDRRDIQNRSSHNVGNLGRADPAGGCVFRPLCFKAQDSSVSFDGSRSKDPVHYPSSSRYGVSDKHWRHPLLLSPP